MVVAPGPRHVELLESLAAATSVTGSHATDLPLPALAVEYQAELHSNDGDFDRFPGLRWRKPLG
jgi:predicted nucleic acid-binding protein